MNIGQVLEIHLGYAAKVLGWKLQHLYLTVQMKNDIVETFEMAGLIRW